MGNLLAWLVGIGDRGGARVYARARRAHAAHSLLELHTLASPEALPPHQSTGTPTDESAAVPGGARRAPRAAAGRLLGPASRCGRRMRRSARWTPPASPVAPNRLLEPGSSTAPSRPTCEWGTRSRCAETCAQLGVNQAHGPAHPFWPRARARAIKINGGNAEQRSKRANCGGDAKRRARRLPGRRQASPLRLLC